MMNFGFDILRASEAAAIAASEFIGCGDKIKADDAATTAMRKVLNAIDGFGARIVIGEGIKDGSPGLLEGENVGWCGDLDWDIAVDPLDGTTQVAKGGPGAMSVIAVGKRKSLFATETFYMKKLAYGPRVVDAIRRIRDYQGKQMNLFSDLEEFVTCLKTQFREKLTVCLLDRPRHADAIEIFHECRWCVRLIQDCDVSAAISTALPDSGIDLYYGIGGTPEGVIAAAAMKCLGGHFEGVLVNEHFEQVDGRLLQTEDLAGGDVIFCATGVTSGDLLKGVQRPGNKTHSVLMCSKTKRIYWINANDVN